MRRNFNPVVFGVISVAFLVVPSTDCFVPGPSLIPLRLEKSLVSKNHPLGQKASLSEDLGHLQQQEYVSVDLPPVDPSTTPRQRDAAQTTTRITLTRFLSNAAKDNPELEDLESLLLAVQMACKTIGNLVNRAGLVYSIQTPQQGQEQQQQQDGSSVAGNDYSDGRFYSMKRLDRLSTTILRNALEFTGNVHIIAPEAKMDSERPEQHQPGVLIASARDSNYVACLDPLDGSGNADASICTGTVFGVFELDEDSRNGVSADGDYEPLLEAVLQPGRNMRAAGYCLYSSATVLVFTLKDGVYGFTLDPQLNEFVLTHDNVTIPRRGNVYSCNEANSEGWSDEWKSYLRKLKLGEGETKTRYTHRYVGSMLGDIHRTLLYGGIFAYPSDRLHKPHGNLQLLYKSAPMAFIVDNAGGKAIDESGANLLDKRPERIHQKSTCFLGSPDDIDELKKELDKKNH